MIQVPPWEGALACVLTRSDWAPAIPYELWWVRHIACSLLSILFSIVVYSSSIPGNSTLISLNMLGFQKGREILGLQWKDTPLRARPIHRVELGSWGRNIWGHFQVPYKVTSPLHPPTATVCGLLWWVICWGENWYFKTKLSDMALKLNLVNLLHFLYSGSFWCPEKVIPWLRNPPFISSPPLCRLPFPHSTRIHCLW